MALQIRLSGTRAAQEVWFWEQVLLILAEEEPELSTRIQTRIKGQPASKVIDIDFPSQVPDWLIGFGERVPAVRPAGHGTCPDPHPP